MSQFVLIGRGGMLGRRWASLLSERRIPHHKPPRAELDLEDESAIDRFVAPGVQCVINCAAWTGVDAAEEREDEATRVNGVAVGRLARRCREVGATLVHYSTDYVFAGDASEPYRTDHPRAPLNAYGRGKALGEELLEDSGADYLLIRTSWLYAPWGKNFVLTIRELARQREHLRIVNDQRGRPSYVDNVARATLALIENGSRGIYHVTDDGDCTWFDLAKLIANQVNDRCVVQPCSSDDFVRPAARPAYSVLDLGRTQAAIGALPDWQTLVRRLLTRLARSGGGADDTPRRFELRTSQIWRPGQGDLQGE